MSKPRKAPGWVRIMVFLLISAGSMALVVRLTVTQETVRAIRRLSWSYLAILGGIWVATVSADALAIILFTRGTGEKLGFPSAVRSSTSRTFFNIVTPFAFGGQPFMVFSLRRRGIPLGKASPIVVTKFTTLTMFNLVGAVGSFVYFRQLFNDIPLVDALFGASAVLAALVVVLLVGTLLNPRLLILVSSAIASVLEKIRLMEPGSNSRVKIVHDALLMRRTFRRYFSRHLAAFIGGILCNGVVYFLQVGLLWVVFYGLGVHLPFLRALASTALLIFLMTFMPTPGSAGLGEGLFVLIFSASVPNYVLGVAVILWRVTYQYLSAGIGALASSKVFSDMIPARSRNSASREDSA